MSRSRKKNPYIGNCAESDAWSKRNAAKKLRRQVRALIQSGAGGDELPFDKDMGSEWEFAKDGKHYWDHPKARRK